jgi:hypothetical protein
LRRLWRDSLVLLACFIVSWILQAWTGWRKFSAEQLQHQQTSSVFGDDGYIWDFLAATFENWQSEFLQLLAIVVLTSFLIHRGSGEFKDSNDRMESSWMRSRTGWTSLLKPSPVARRITRGNDGGRDDAKER